MEFEWDSLLIFMAFLAGILPFLIPRLKKVWKWYHKMQSGGETLSEHVARVEKEFKEKGK